MVYVTDRYAKILPPDLLRSLTQLGGQIRGGTVDLALVSWIIDRCGALPLRRFEETGSAIRVLAELYQMTVLIRPGGFILRLFGQSKGADLAVMRKTPGLETVFLLHGSGWLREAALENLRGPAPSAFWMAILAHRLNDWVPEVRKAAVGAFDRVLASTSPAILVRTFVALLDRTNEWSRWTFEEERFRAMLQQPGVKDEIISMLMNERDGPLARILRMLLKGPDYDGDLVQLARGAGHSAVRAVALETLLFGRARWLAGRQRKWVDKTLGQWRMEPRFETRTVHPPCTFEELIQLGMADKASVVRKVVAAALIHQPELTGTLEQMVRALAVDRNPGIRERAKFILGRLREEV